MTQADAIIVGGGIQGVSMALAAARRGLQPVLIERTQLAAGASGGSYGIVHGGLRYLQTMDVSRWKRSRKAQAWYLEQFPEYVKPLRCVMPLYRGCMRSPTLFRAAIAVEKVLVSALNAKVPLPSTYLMSVNEALQEFDIPSQGLAGAACWHDAEVSDMPGLLSAMLKKAGLDEHSRYIPFDANELMTAQGRVEGLQVRNSQTGERTALHSNIVINCAGAWAGSWQRNAACPTAKTLAFNLVLEGRLPGNSALAVSAISGKGRSYFLRPHPEGIFVGTYYRPAPDDHDPVVSQADIEAFLNELDVAMPMLDLRQAAVKAVMAGLLPDKDGTGRTLSSKEHILKHQPEGFYSIVGGKFTTAPLLSEEAAEIIWPANSASTPVPTELVKRHA